MSSLTREGLPRRGSIIQPRVVRQRTTLGIGPFLFNPSLKGTDTSPVGVFIPFRDGTRAGRPCHVAWASCPCKCPNFSHPFQGWEFIVITDSPSVAKAPRTPEKEGERRGFLASPVDPFNLCSVHDFRNTMTVFISIRARTLAPALHRLPPANRVRA
jgi:hypothetical protein